MGQSDSSWVQQVNRVACPKRPLVGFLRETEFYKLAVSFEVQSETHYQREGGVERQKGVQDERRKMMINIQLTLIDEKQTRLTSFFIIYHQQMGFLLFVARVLIVTALASSAYHHLNAPQTSVLEFQTNYKILDTLSNQYLSFDIPYDNTNWVTGVLIFGLFEALVTLLIIFGDSLGGFLYVVSITLEIFFMVWPRFVSKTLASWNFQQLQELSHFGALLGIGLILVSGVPVAKKA